MQASSLKIEGKTLAHEFGTSEGEAKHCRLTVICAFFSLQFPANPCNFVWPFNSKRIRDHLLLMSYEI